VSDRSVVIFIKPEGR